MRIFIAAFLMFGLCGCAGNVETSDGKLAAQTEQTMQEANRQVGMPAITNFQERKLAKMIFELRDKEDYICHAYLVNEMNGTVGQYLGRCLGYGLPYSVQYTNPEKVVRGEREVGVDFHGSFDVDRLMILPQPDPNGLFMPQGLSATWIMLLDDTGTPRPVYVEPPIIVSPVKLR